MKKIVILGGGESGVGAALLAKKQGFDVFLSDGGKLKDDNKRELTDAAIDFEEGQHTEARIMAADEIIKSPGVPEKAEIMKHVRAKGIHVISEIEFAARYTKSRLIGITGANGKTTTTLLTHHLLSQNGVKAELAGNIGTSLARKVALDVVPDWFVIELSSFQLDGMYDTRLDIAILTNITPDHLDRYEYKFENYIRSKFRVVQNQTSRENFIFNTDDPVTSEWIGSVNVGGAAHGVSTKNTERAYAHDGVIISNTLKINVSELPIKGLHNTYNTMQAVVAAQIAGVSDEGIIQALKTFKNAEHRLEYVRTIDGVDFVNDSKATNVDSAWYALECQTKPVVWIAGGTDKGNDYTTLLPLVRQKVRALVCLGLDNAKLFSSFQDVVPVYETKSIAACVDRCRELAEPGDVVLLSPCCASFDLFTSYINRGNLFKEYILSIKN